MGRMGAAEGGEALLRAGRARPRGGIPPSPYFTAPSPRLHLDDSGLFVNAQPLPMPGSPRRAAVNSLGIGGTHPSAGLGQAAGRTPAGRGPGAGPLPVSAESGGAPLGAAPRGGGGAPQT